MSSSEKPTTKIWVGVVTAVLGFIVIAALTNVWLHWILPLYNLVVHQLTTALGWITSSHLIPGWLLVLLAVAFPVARWIKGKVADFQKPSPPPEPDWREFRQFKYLGLVWRWEYNNDARIFNLCSFCPTSGCDMQIAGSNSIGMYNIVTRYHCHRCNCTQDIDGCSSDIETKTTLEIQRLFRTGEWRKAMTGIP